MAAFEIQGDIVFADPVFADAVHTDTALTDLQRAQLDAAMTYHALCNPGAVITYFVTIGDIDELPITSDRRTVDGFDGFGTGGAAADFTVQARSSTLDARGERGTTGEVLYRYLRLGHADATPATTRPSAPPSLPRRIYRELERNASTAVDTVRETVMRRRERAISLPLPRYPDAPGSDAISDAYADRTVSNEVPEGAQPAILFGLHWLQTGGAERWAIESIQAAKDAGFLPVVVTDQNSVHPWLLRPELEDCVVVTMSFDGHESPLDPELTNAIVQNYDLRGIVIHHSYWLYRALPWIRRWRPQVPVVDSLHIVEYLGGGYPGISVRFDDFIDQHHTISPELDRWLVDVQGVGPEKLVMAPLTALTVDASREFKARDPEQPFTISYVGRLSRQKRPDVFLMLVYRLVQEGVPVRAILHGDGELAYLVDGLLDRFGLRDSIGLSDVVEQRFEDSSVADTLAESDLLVISSINEGLTLTTFEAIAAGVPVLSADVGSQRTIVQGGMLVPRPASDFVRGAAVQIKRFIVSDTAREHAWNEQRDRVAEFAKHPDAHHIFKELFAQWQE
ncbi:MAG: glycosyltransferase [Leucobacter sp.]